VRGLQGSGADGRFISADQTDKMLAPCPDLQWRLIVALSRYGGLRCPSETLALKWADVDWEQSRIRVRSPKTEHHEGGGIRETPLFPELRPLLQEAWDSEESLPEHVITRYRDPTANLRTEMLRIIRRAGLEPWRSRFTFCGPVGKPN
jgi:integrase